jgi:hypothetical protein
MEKELFQLALNIQDPWFIDRIKFLPAEMRLDLWIVVTIHPPFFQFHKTKPFDQYIMNHIIMYDD